MAATIQDLENLGLAPAVQVDQAGRPTAANVPMGFSQTTVLTSSVPLLLIPGGSTLAIIQCQGQPVRWRDDGTAPTSTVGMLMNVGDVLRYDGPIEKLRFIETAASATLNVSFYS